MASELRITTLANNAGTESVDTTYVINGSVKNWVVPNQSYVIQASFNTSSITDEGGGAPNDSTVALTSSFSSGNFVAAGSNDPVTNAARMFGRGDNSSSGQYKVNLYRVDSTTTATGNVALTMAIGDLA
jgi:hypothetical protein